MINILKYHECYYINNIRNNYGHHSFIFTYVLLLNGETIPIFTTYVHVGTHVRRNVKNGS